MTRVSFINWRRFGVLLLLLSFGAAAYWYWLRDTGAEHIGMNVQSARIVEAADGRDYGVEKGDYARDFEVSSFGGERFRLSDLRGSPVALKFWATWCSSCLKEFEVLKDLRPEYEDDGLRVLAVNTGEPYEDGLEFVEFLDQPFDWVLDPTLAVADGYRVIGFPVSIFIDREGVIRGVHVGEMNREDTVRFFDGAVSAAPIPDGPRKLRLITTLPREHVLYVEEKTEPGELALRSKSLRCDDSYCADVVAERVRAVSTVQSAMFDRDIDPPALIISFDPDNGAVVALIVREVRTTLDDLADPLYERSVEVREAGAE